MHHYHHVHFIFLFLKILIQDLTYVVNVGPELLILPVSTSQVLRLYKKTTISCLILVVLTT